MSYAYDGLPEDFLERFRDRIEAVTEADVRRAAGRWLRPDAAPLLIQVPASELTRLRPAGR